MALFSKKNSVEEKPKTVAKTTVKKDKEEKTAEPVSMQDLYAADKTVKGGKAKTAKTKIKPNTQAYRVLVKPLITEKTTALNGLHKFIFMVAPTANKITVAKAIEDLYGLKPVKVNIIKMEGKLKSRGRIQGRRKDWKKAIVTLKSGDSLDVYEGV